MFHRFTFLVNYTTMQSQQGNDFKFIHELGGIPHEKHEFLYCNRNRIPDFGRSYRFLDDRP